jgi:hypothetical protein
MRVDLFQAINRGAEVAVVAASGQSSRGEDYQDKKGIFSGIRFSLIPEPPIKRSVYYSVSIFCSFRFTCNSFPAYPPY